MTGPTIGFTVAGTDYGGCAQQVDLWQETLNGIGRWEVIVDPTGPCAWPAIRAITPDMAVTITIGGVTMMRGYVDDVLPYLDRKGYHTKLYRITGRNRGMDLAQHQVSATYQNVAADAIIGNAAGSLLTLIPAPTTELTRVTVGAAPGVLDYEADKTYLTDAVREICNLVGYDFYVDNTNWPANANLNMFAYGLSPSGVTLISFPASTTNNIRHVEPCGEYVGFNIKNDILGHAGSLEDHYTDLNAVDWAGTNCAVTDETTVFLNGKGAIKFENDTGGIAFSNIDLTFPRYSYDAAVGRPVDLSEPCIGSFNYLVHDTNNATKSVSLRLTDAAGTAIRFDRSLFVGLLKCRNCTFQPTNDEWRKVDFPLGEESGIESPAVPGGGSKGSWNYVVAAPPPVFNWYDVREISFLAPSGVQGWNDEDYAIIDGLSFPNHEVRSIQQDGPGAGTSITLYGRRMKDFYRPDIKNQYELDAFATQKLAELKDPKETIRVVASGQTGTPFAAQTVEVVATLFGIGGPLIGDTVTYRIVRLHHRVVRGSDESDEEGYTFTTEYDLVRHQYYGTVVTQLLDHTKHINITDPVESYQRDIRLQESFRRRDGNVRLSP